ncbi:hypothetical protein FB446DRAFT_772416 [Lentinula raphanica]|nr:hypothetical protein FB446DRAFT_772416 [Lentinula raphanica]
MLHSASVLSFILWSSYLSLGCFPLPLSETSSKSAPSEAGVSANLTKRDPTAGKFFLGYRYTEVGAALEYEHYAGKSLTDYPATLFQLGEGAYLGPVTGVWGNEHQDWLCEIWVDPSKFEAAPRRMISNELVRERSGLPPLSQPVRHPTLSEVIEGGLRNVDPEAHMEGIWNDIKSHGQKVEDTILVSGGNGDPAKKCFQMLIPPYYLRPSIISKRPGGKGDLGMYVKCVRKVDCAYGY